MKTKLPIGPFAILLGALCASTTGTAQALAPEGATSLSMGSLRLLGGGVSLFLFCLITRNLPKLSHWPKFRMLAGAAGLLGFQLGFFFSVKLVGVAVGSIVAVGSSPIMVGILGWFLLREKPSGLWCGATTLSIGGLVLLSLSSGGGQFNLIGLALALSAGLSYACFLIAVKPVLEKFDPIHIMMLIFLLGGFAMVPVLVTQPLAWIGSLRGVLVVLDLGVLTTAAAFTLILFGMRTTPVAVTSTLGLAEPLGATLLGVFLLKEVMTTSTVIGIFLIFFSMVLLVLEKPSEKILDNNNVSAAA